MASELRVNTLKDAAGNNSVAMQYVANGSAKVTILFNQEGTLANLYSFGVSSISDGGTGKTTVSFTNSFNSANYTPTGMGGENGSLAQTRTQNIGTMASGSSLILGHLTSGLEDLERMGATYFGDLA
jgi:hypothetical protein